MQERRVSINRGVQARHHLVVRLQYRKLDVAVYPSCSKMSRKMSKISKPGRGSTSVREGQREADQAAGRARWAVYPSCSKMSSKTSSKHTAHLARPASGWDVLQASERERQKHADREARRARWAV
jgi:hypothetical protein